MKGSVTDGSRSPVTGRGHGHTLDLPVRRARTPLTDQERAEIQADLNELRDNLQQTLETPALLTAEHRRVDYILRAAREIARLERLLAS